MELRGKEEEGVGRGIRKWKWRSESKGGVGRGMEKGWKVGSEWEGRERGRQGWKRRGRGRKAGK